MGTSNVVLVDLREEPGDLPAEVAGGVLVLDHAGSLVKHADTYLSLVGEGMVTGVVCLAIGESTTDNPLDGVVLEIPPALQHATVLWIGDTRGVDWAPESPPPRPVAVPGEALDGLVAALRVPELFDRVVAVAGELSSSAANPGIQLVSSTATQTELAEARAAAVQSLCSADEPPSRKLGATVAGLDGRHDPEGSVLSGRIDEARSEARRRIDHVAQLARELGTWNAVFFSSRPTEHLGGQVTLAGQAAEKYRLLLVELLNRVDGQLQCEDPPVEKVVELGVQDPRHARGAEIAAELREVVESRLAGGVSLPVLEQELRFAAAVSAPQGCTATLEEVGRRGPLSLAMPEFRQWPLGPSILPLIFLSCVALPMLLGRGWFGWVAGGLLAAGWLGSGWLLLARRPGPERESGFDATLIPSVVVYGMVGFVGVLAGAIDAGSPVFWPLGQALALLVVLFSAAVVVLAWLTAVHRWRKALPIGALRATIVELTRLTEEVITREWQPMRRRRAIVAAVTEVADALKEIAQTLEDGGNRLFVAPRFEPGADPDDPPSIVRPVPQELYGVIRGDFVDLCRGALEPAWPAARAGLGTPQAVYAQRLDRLLGEYGGDVRHHGLLLATQFSRDPAPRDALMARVWSESPGALAALRTGADGDMTQLCRSGQLGYLSTVTEPGLVRFAPRRLRRVLEQDGAYQRLAVDPGIVWSDGGEFVGALRLLPLRPESLRQVLGGVV